MYDAQYFSTIMQAMKNEANEVATLDILANGGIPEDCNCLVISTLKEDLTEQEKDKITYSSNTFWKLLKLAFVMLGPHINSISPPFLKIVT